MNLGKGYFKEFFNKLNTIDLILNSILSFCISVFLFYIFFPNNGYSNLKDFFVGETIYSNYNKFYDIYFVFIFIILFFLTLLVYKKFKTIVFEQNITQTKLTGRIFYSLQYISLLSYFIIYPFDGHFYKGLFVLALLLIAAGIYDIQRLQKLSRQDGLIHFSVFSITAIALLCFGRFYSAQHFYIDTHHDAEHFSAYYMHTVHKMTYYKDIMLVHGGRDLAESWLAAHFFGSNNLYTYLLGKALFFNIIIIVFSFLALFVFGKNPIVLLPLVSLYRNDEPTGLLGIYLLVYFALLKDKIFNKTSVFLSLYIVSAILFFMFWTTLGILWAAALLPVVLYKLIITLKEKDFKQLITPTIVLFVCLLVFAKDLYYFAQQAGFYTAGNIYGFGTAMVLNIKKWNIYLKLASILAVPSFIFLLVKEFLSESKNTKYLFVLLSSVLLILLSLNYSIGRIDGSQFTRVFIISVNTLFVIVPFLVYQKCKDNYSDLIKYILLVATVFLSITVLTKTHYALLFKRISPHKEKSLNVNYMLDSKNSANDSMHRTLGFLNKYLKKEDTFLDLTNNGILYYVFNKKLPMPYTSFYNIVSDKQAHYTLNILNPTYPDKILISRADFPLDHVYPSLRINPIYRHLLLSGKYKLVVDDTKSVGLLIKTDRDGQKFSEFDYQFLDDCFSMKNLGYLPDVWGNKPEFKTQQIQLNYMLEKIVIPQGTIFIIRFQTPIKGSDIDLINFDIKNKTKSSWVMQINSSQAMLFFETKTGEMLIPFDNYPSWLLNETITEIAIKTNSDIKEIPEIKFFKRR